ncbi:uncharacterized protein LOC127561655 [Antechinus flavipes]|uniref:uncharacterized protein LOC127561655 n=1 Tax=Antechinus flavipes TaxID=38775 RepID=UPI00223615F3|nr:uncharacterized protein LOC127561655 [Antechinus flavipes]
MQPRDRGGEAQEGDAYEGLERKRSAPPPPKKCLIRRTRGSEEYARQPSGYRLLQCTSPNPEVWTLPSSPSFSQATRPRPAAGGASQPIKFSRDCSAQAQVSPRPTHPSPPPGPAPSKISSPRAGRGCPRPQRQPDLPKKRSPRPTPAFQLQPSVRRVPKTPHPTGAAAATTAARRPLIVTMPGAPARPDPSTSGYVFQSSSHHTSQPTSTTPPKPATASRRTPPPSRPRSLPNPELPSLILHPTFFPSSGVVPFQLLTGRD